MTDDIPTGAQTWRAGRFLIAAGAAVAAHLLATLAAMAAARIVQPSSGGGVEDLAAAITVFLAAQLVIALGCLIGGAILIVRGSRDRGLGLLLGWAAGVVVLAVLLPR